ncbi:integrase [Brevibacillus choshinensis]|uniref:Integrase n=1 Tax=Brevibacillus choshinensis TaxID=54911 RepID=A0ABR5N261_BRECH|nr:site-specific integrase [Brevibacillus choshinensis]KQL44589.1 integrase [Brevibacillus choshinensis]
MASIQKRGDNSYLLVVESGYSANGKRLKRTKTIRITEKLTPKKLKEHLELELTKFKIDVESGEYISPEKMLFSEFVEKEWTKKFAEKELSPLTLITYLVHLKTHINPVFGHLQLSQIKTIHVVSFINELEKSRKDGKGDTLSASTVLYIYKVLKSVLDRATDWRLINRNPMDDTKQPKIERRKMKFYEENEVRDVIAALYEEPTHWRLYFLGAMLGGYRRGELLALEWDDVNFIENTFSLQKSISLTEDGKAVVKKPKTEESERIVVMPDWYIRELKDYYNEWKKVQQQCGDQWTAGNRQYVFHNGIGKPYYHTTPTATWHTFIKRHGLKHIRLHDLRHTAATLLIDAGVGLKAIQERLGHTKHQTTADLYAHVTKKVSREAAEKLDKFDPRGPGAE